MLGWLIKKFVTRIPDYQEPRQMKLVQNTKYEYLEADLDVLIWNLHKSRAPESKADFDALMQDVDLALFQEHWVGGNLSAHIALYPVTSIFGYMYDYRGYPTGCLTVAKAKSQYSQAWPSVDHEPIVKTPKMVLETKFASAGSGGELILVLNIHGLLFASFEAWKHQVEEAFGLIKAHKGPVLFAGDFNTKNKERLHHLLALCVKHNITYHDLKSDKYDQVLTRGLKLIEQVKVIRKKSSDHLPIRLKFAL
jgi:endonuclease/exonuclease/phosphatase (EEP) superfamily protein YafD